MREESRAAPVSGELFLADRLEELIAHVQNGRVCEVAFDLDNTLFDTRTRTMWAAHAFDQTHATTHFKAITLDQVGWDGRATCDRMGNVSPQVTNAFAQFWEEKFWDGSAFVHDAPVESVLSWARRAAQAGAEVRFLTGRIEALREATSLQLSNAGFGGVTAASLWMKPDLSTWTLGFKESMLRNAMQRGWLGWYVTEGRDEIAHLQTAMPDGPWILVDCSLQRRNAPVAVHTPTLARTF